MSRAAISVENLSKAYRIGLKEEIPDTIVGAVTGVLKSPLRNWRRLRGLNTYAEAAGGQRSEVRGQRPEDGGNENGHSHTSSLTTENRQLSTLPSTPSDLMWALKDVSFEVQEGEVLGIIGRNGAGKSTLLKILSRITEPTSGRAVIRGRVSSLLEVGTGFHPELSGRENVYMNGTILGMRKREIDRKFDEIVDFSGVEQFLDTPIKRYSSGMKVRLAFSVAAHLEPEILIIDEVLAVGDTEFQRKCIGRMHSVAQSGRTVLFVSHNTAALRSLCDKGVLLEFGTVSLAAPLEEVLATYLGRIHLAAHTPLSLRSDRQGRGDVRFASVEIANTDGASGITLGMPAYVTFRLSRPRCDVDCSFRVFDEDDTLVFTCDTRLRAVDEPRFSAAVGTLVCELPEMLLMPGRYRVDATLFRNGVREDRLDGAAYFDVQFGYLRGRQVKLAKQRPLVALPHRWHSST